MYIVVIGLISGLLIGAVGIGGVLLSPMLTFILGIDIHTAMASSSWSFLFTGIVGTIAYARKGLVPWPMVGLLAVRILPGSFLGANVNNLLQSNLLLIILSVLIALSGVHAIFRKISGSQFVPKDGDLKILTVGFVVGFGSALTGTGGPVILVPTLLFLGYPTLFSIGVSQAIQLPIAISAAIGFGMHDRIDFQLGTILGVIQAFAVVLGAKYSQGLPSQRLRKLVAVILIFVGIFLLARSLI